MRAKPGGKGTSPTLRKTEFEQGVAYVVTYAYKHISVKPPIRVVKKGV